MATTIYWTVADLAHHLSLSYDTVQKWTYPHAGPAPYMVVRGHRIYRPADVHAWQRSLLEAVA
jgi:hypothetical protein